MDRLILLNKPFQVLCQFSVPAGSGKKTLADYVTAPGVYPAGRLDYDSEGLVVLTSAGWLQHRIADPAHKLPKTYWVQVEGLPSDAVLQRLASGILLNDGLTLPARVSRLVDPRPPVWERVPPIRVRKSIPDCWLSVTLREGRNRQLRRMMAAIGHPALRLIRARVGDWGLEGIETPGQWRDVSIPVRR